jgi:hypothetical protein
LAQDAIRNKNAVELATTQNTWANQRFNDQKTWDEKLARLANDLAVARDKDKFNMGVVEKQIGFGNEMAIAQVKANNAAEIKTATQNRDYDVRRLEEIRKNAEGLYSDEEVERAKYRLEIMHGRGVELPEVSKTTPPTAEQTATPPVETAKQTTAPPPKPPPENPYIQALRSLKRSDEYINASKEGKDRMDDALIKASKGQITPYAKVLMGSLNKIGN